MLTYSQLILQLESTWLPLASRLGFFPHPKADPVRFPQWMHVLRPIIDENDVLNGGESRDGGGWNGRLHAMRMELRALRVHLSQTIAEQDAALEKKHVLLQEQMKPLVQVCAYVHMPICPYVHVHGHVHVRVHVRSRRSTCCSRSR